MPDQPETAANPTPPDNLPTMPAPSANPSRDVVAGRYKLLEQLGQGGMGVVYMAEQSHPVRRLVALKIIKPGMDSREVVTRFEAERQALALMDHPNIAKVLDAGTTDEGRPFFVMELVKGKPITQYCDEHQLAPRDRLALLASICQAVQHAHQKGIIHRDLKPSNVLVAQYDDQPVPKVIDFGVAKAVGQKLTENTLYTGFGALVGTLEYMSPEQAQFNQLDIDTRSDVYSLGVILYELLTGSTPFEKKRLRTAALAEVLRVIREEEPPRPSTRLSTVDELPSIAAKRGMEPKRLSLTVQGELDWIVMKALEKDRNRRYESANGLALDLQRYLGDEPVLACPPSTAYRVRKWISRHRAAFVIGSAACLMVLAGLVGLAISRELILREMKATAEALVAKNDALRTAEAARVEELKQRQLAEQEQAEAERQQQRADRNFQTAREAVDRMLTRVAHELRGQPQTEKIRTELLEDALRFHQDFLQEQGADPAIRFEAGMSALRIGNLHGFLQHGMDAGRNYEMALKIFQELHQVDPDLPIYKQQLATVHEKLCGAELALNRHDSAWKHLELAIQLREELASAHPDRPEDLQQAAKVNWIAGRFWQGQYHFKRAYPFDQRWKELKSEIGRKFPGLEVDGKLLAGANEIIPPDQANPGPAGFAGLPPGRNYGLLPHDDEILRNYAEELKLAVAYWEQEKDAHPEAPAYERSYLQHVDYLARILFAQDRQTDLQLLLKHKTASFTRLAARFPESPEYQVSAAWECNALANYQFLWGQLDEAQENYRRGIEILRSFAEKFPENLRYQSHLSGMLISCPVSELQQPELAIAAAKRVIEIGDDYGWTWGELAFAQTLAGRLEDAKASLAMAREKVGPNPELVTIEMLDLYEVGLRLELEETDAARNLFQRAVQTIDTTTNRRWFTPQYRLLKAGFQARLDLLKAPTE